MNASKNKVPGKFSGVFSLENISFGLMVGLVFLLPIFFLPINGISLDVGKGLILSVVTILSLVAWLAGRLVDGEVKIPRNLILAGVFGIALTFLISALFSPAQAVSMFGQGFEVGTFTFILMVSLLSVIASLVLDSRKKVISLYVGILASFALLALYHIIRLFAGPGVLSFGMFPDQVSNMLGKWNDVGIFFGLVSVLVVSALELLKLRTLHKVILYIALIISLFFLAVINFTFGWGVLAGISLVIFIYGIYLNKYENSSENNVLVPPSAIRARWVALLVAIIAIFFVMTSGGIGGSLATRFNASQIEVRPSWSATIDIAKDTLKAHPVLGSGPNRFYNEWLLHKPDVLNNTIFWSTDFNAGVGIVPTFVITTGLLGLLAWLFFFGSFLYCGIRAVSTFQGERVSQFLVLSSFLASLYLWLFTIIYVPNVTIAVFTFLMTGVFVATLMTENLTGKFEFSLLGNPKLGFVSVLVLIFLIIASVAFGYLLSQKTMAIFDFQKAVVALNNQGNIDISESSAVKAANLSPSDVYYRGLSQLALARINNLFQQKDLKPDVAKTQFTSLMGNAVQSAKQAINYDETNYINWMNLGGIYEAVVPLGINGAYDEAVKSYNKAMEVAPKNPLIYYTLARLEVANKNTKAARENLNKALEMKNDYTEALFFLSQIEASEGNLTEAITKAEQASLLSPNDVGLFFQLGLLKYTNKDYTGAVESLERATTLTPDYANAMYFLGLSYDKTNHKSDAVKQFNRLAELNPDNQEIKNILANLKAGKDALSNVAPPGPAPEKKKSPPIKETKKAQGEL